MEESEHKAVAFDVYREAGGTYVTRASMMLLTTVVFLAVQFAAHTKLMTTRGILSKPWTWARGFARLCLYPALLPRLLPAYLAYFKPRFHPNDRDTRALVAEWRERLFGSQGWIELTASLVS